MPQNDCNMRVVAGINDKAGYRSGPRPMVRQKWPRLERREGEFASSSGRDRFGIAELFHRVQGRETDMKSSASASKKRTSSVASVKRKPVGRKGRPAQREAALEVLKKFRQIFRAAKMHFNAVEKRA